MSRKALFFDVDGTLMSDLTHTVPESAVCALSETRKRGNLVFINSGRTWNFLGEIKDLVEADGYLCGCGTCIVVDGKAEYRYRIPHEKGLEVKKKILEYGLDGILEAYEGMYIRRKPSWIAAMEEMKQRMMKKNLQASHDWDDDCYDFDKFCMFADSESDREGLFAWLAPDFQVLDRGHDFYECVPAGHSKATAIQWVMDRYGIAPEDVYVFGDSSNDLSMFEFAENAVLMEAHDPVLEPYATFVTKTVEEDGIAWAMKELGLIG